MINRDKLLNSLCLSKNQGNICDYCRDDGECRVNEKTDEQVKYILSSIEQSIFLKACPGSGKTEVVAMKVAHEISSWSKNGGMAVLSFTNNAADVIAERLTEFSGVQGISHPHFIGTFDGWLHSYFAHPFLHRITNYSGDKEFDKSFILVNQKDTPQRKSKEYLFAYKAKTPFPILSDDRLTTIPIFANNFIWDGEWYISNPIDSYSDLVSLETFCSSPAFERYKLEKDRNGSDKRWLAKKHVQSAIEEIKNKFNQSGFATYNDIERLCLQLLNKDHEVASLISQRFPFVIVDEAQDLSSLQLGIIQKLKDMGSHIHFVGDTNQAIYEFKKADPKFVENFCEINCMNIMQLTNNFRSSQNIVDISNRIIPNSTPVKGNPKINDMNSHFVLYKEGEIADLPCWFEKYLKKINYPEDKNSVIVARGWPTIYKMCSSENNGFKAQHEVAFAIKSWQEPRDEYLASAISYMGKFVASNFFREFSASSNQFHRPTVVSVSSEWRSLIAAILNELVKCSEIVTLNVKWSVWAKAFKEQISTIVEKHQCNLSYMQAGYRFSPQKIDFKSPSGQAEFKVIDTLAVKDERAPIKIPIKTIHAVKGQTFDAVMVVSSSSKGRSGHWEKWLEDSNKEPARFAYVASSRPKQVLVWAIPYTDDKDELNHLGLVELGWEIENV